MLGTIHFDHESSRQADEIEGVRASRHLTKELMAKRSVPENAPEATLGRCHVMSKVTGEGQAIHA
jgi:hypothetical protein